MRTFLAARFVIALIYVCAAADADTCAEAERGECSPGALSRYALQSSSTKKFGGINLSGGAFHSASCTLWMVRNNPMTLEHYDPATQTLINTVELKGGFNDPEGLCMFGDSTIVIAEERVHKLTLCPLPSDTDTSLQQSECTIIAPGITGFDPNDSNKGFEGVACDEANNRLIVLQEQNPMKVWSVDATTGAFELLVDAESQWKSHVGDIAGVSLDKTSNTLIVLSQVSKKVIRVEMDGTVLDSMSVSVANHPEGVLITPNNEEIWVIGEDDELFEYRIDSPSSLDCGDGALDVCGCPLGQGWSSTSKECKEGSTTSDEEAAACEATPTTGAPTIASYDACGCQIGVEGWSSTSKVCKSGSTTTEEEAAACAVTPTSAPTKASYDACGCQIGVEGWSSTSKVCKSGSTTTDEEAAACAVTPTSAPSTSPTQSSSLDACGCQIGAEGWSSTSNECKSGSTTTSEEMESCQNVDDCGCMVGVEGWSSSKGECRKGATTRSSEARLCRQGTPASGVADNDEDDPTDGTGRNKNDDKSSSSSWVYYVIGGCVFFAGVAAGVVYRSIKITEAKRESTRMELAAAPQFRGSKMSAFEDTEAQQVIKNL